MSDESIKALLVPKPDWAREFSVIIPDADCEVGYRRIHDRWDEIGPRLHTLIEEFFNDPDCAFLSEEEGFPLRERLTGEYYIGDSWCDHELVQGRTVVYCSVMFRCLEKKWMDDYENRDYLGLSAGIYLWLDTGEIKFDVGFNTESI